MLNLYDIGILFHSSNDIIFISFIENIGEFDKNTILDK